MRSELFKKIGFVLVLATGLALASGPVMGAEPIKIGIVSPVSGNFADHGMLERIGMEMALEDYNNEILGRPITLIVADDETNPDVAARRARRLIEVDGVKFLMGGVSTSTGLSVGAVAEEKKVLYICTNQNGDQITGESARHHVFRVPPDMAMLVRSGAKEAADTLGKKWFFLTHDYSWGHSGTMWARKTLNKVGAAEMGEIKVPLNTRDFSSQLLQVRNSGADLLVITVAGFDNVSLMKQMAEMKIYDKMKVWYTLMDLVDLWAIDPAERQAYFCAEMYYMETPETQKFTERFAKKFPRAAVPVLDTGTYNGWLSMKILLEAIKKAGTADSVEKVICAMEGLEVKDNMRKFPSKVRAWDHQVTTEVVFLKANPLAKGTNIADIKKEVSGEEFARTKEENLDKDNKPVNVSCQK
jgi:branched-chain amino acid transport system substrate-binding protein